MKELIFMYAPMVFCGVASFVGLIKTGKIMRSNAKTIIESKEYNSLKREMKILRESLACQNRYNVEIINQNREILKREDERKDEEAKKEI